MNARRIARILVVAALACIAQVVFAQAFIKREIHDDPRGGVRARLLASFWAHAKPLCAWYTAALQGRRVTTYEFAPLARQFESATFASATYRFTVNGQQRTRVYHARSGRNEPDIGLPGVTVRLPYGGFFQHTAPSVVAWDRFAPADSSVTHSPVDDGRHPDARRRDAELKIARQIEADIAAGDVTGGGWINVYVSQAPCESCERALRELSRTHDIRVHIAYFGRGSPAYRTFQRLRETVMSTLQVVANDGLLNTLLLERNTPGCDRACPEENESNNDP